MSDRPSIEDLIRRRYPDAERISIDGVEMDHVLVEVDGEPVRVELVDVQASVRLSPATDMVDVTIVTRPS